VKHTVFKGELTLFPFIRGKVAQTKAAHPLKGSPFGRNPRLFTSTFDESALAPAGDWSTRFIAGPPQTSGQSAPPFSRKKPNIVQQRIGPFSAGRRSCSRWERMRRSATSAILTCRRSCALSGQASSPGLSTGARNGSRWGCVRRSECSPQPPLTSRPKTPSASGSRKHVSSREETRRRWLICMRAGGGGQNSTENTQAQRSISPKR
jgi:hypothetical protein